jgi:hypothetical protein
MKWRKSSYSSNGENTCVEVRRASSQNFAARDSKAPEDPVLHLSKSDFARLLTDVKAGRFDLSG